MRVTATEARSRSGSPCACAEREPVVVNKVGPVDSVTHSVEHRQALGDDQDQPNPAARRKAFEAEFGGWIAEQNARVDSQGVPGADLRPW